MEMNELKTNLLCWYPFKKDTDILEIFHKESCFSDGERIDRIDFRLFTDISGKYDYIVLNDVFRLSPERFPDNPHYSFLNECKKALKENGHILLSIENRFALKYFAGEQDLFYKKSYFGMNPNPNLDHVLFTKTELESILADLGFKNIRFYYPYPNHLEPFEIFTDSSINRQRPAIPQHLLAEDSIKVFDEECVGDELAGMNIAQFFAESFLVDISNENSCCGIDYVKISSNRREEFRICTVIDYGSKKVYKKALSPSSTKHIRDIEKNSTKKGLYPQLPYVWKNGTAECDFLTCSSLKELMTGCGKSTEILEEIKRKTSVGEYRLYQEDERFTEVFGTEKTQQKLHWQKDINIDLIPDNVFHTDEGWVLIDPEWFFSFPIPMEFIRWRFVYKSGNIFPDKKSMIDYLEIDEETESVFSKWNEYFMYDYVGSQHLNYKAAPIVDLTEIYEKSLEADLASEIVNSRIWKATRPVRVFFDFFKKKR